MDRPTQAVRDALDELTATAIVTHTHRHYQGFQFDGDWLDRWRERVDALLDALDGEVCHDAGA